MIDDIGLWRLRLQRVKRASGKNFAIPYRHSLGYFSCCLGRLRQKGRSVIGKHMSAQDDIVLHLGPSLFLPNRSGQDTRRSSLGK